ncbi:MAG: aldehyde dehydrogenase family protein [Acidimicrobiales bacterium]
MAELWHEERLYVDGELVAADGAKTYDNLNPATEEVLGVAADASVGDIDRAVAAARRAFDETDWSRNVDLRVRCLRQLHDAIQGQLEPFRALTVAEVGSPVALTYGPQLDGPVTFLPWYADLAERYEWTEDLGDAEPMGIPSHRWIEREAVGVVGAITAWNFPTQLNLAKIAPALAAGNTVVLKAAPATPWSALVLGQLAAEHTDLPPGVLNVITSRQNDIGEAITTDPRVDLITFTGSTAVGKRIMAAASDTVKKVFLELGGKSAIVALDDCDMNAAAGTGAFGVCTHAGQGCAITTRLLLPRSRYDEGVEIAKTVLESMPYGDPTDPGNFMGPLVTDVQRERVEGLIRTAQDEGATLVTGGKRPAHLDKGWFVEPTLLVDVDPDSTIAQQEVFGPVLAVIPFDDDDDAVHIANNSIYGLSGAVNSGDIERAKAVGRRIRSGTMSINGGVYYGADVPFGGYRQSGLGREMGIEGFEEYLETKSFAEPA